MLNSPTCILHDRERRFPLNDKKYQIGLLAVVLLVALRLTIGWHFFYEGVWKIANADKFSASDFLIMSKGPFVPLFHAMVPDLDGRVRLGTEPLEEKEGWVTSPVYLAAWTEVKDKFIAKNRLEGRLQEDVEKKFEQYEESLAAFMTDNQEDIDAHFLALDRFITRKNSGANGAEHEKVRIWEEQVKLRGAAKGWLSELDTMGEEMCFALYGVLERAPTDGKGKVLESEEEKATRLQKLARAKVPAVVTAPEKMPVPLPFFKSRTHFLDVTVTYALTAIGLCMLLGFCNRLACLGGGAFLISVLMTQPPWPTLIPHAPAVVGHALIVDKNFVEMVAIFMLAALPVGRWAGLDHFLYHWIGRPIEAKIPFLQKLSG